MMLIFRLVKAVHVSLANQVLPTICVAEELHLAALKRHPREHLLALEIQPLPLRRDLSE
jgi:hypothetical protein